MDFIAFNAGFQTKFILKYWYIFFSFEGLVQFYLKSSAYCVLVTKMFNQNFVFFFFQEWRTSFVSSRLQVFPTIGSQVRYKHTEKGSFTFFIRDRGVEKVSWVTFKWSVYVLLQTVLMKAKHKICNEFLSPLKLNDPKH